MAPSSSPQCGDASIDDVDRCHQHGNSSSSSLPSQSNNNNDNDNNNKSNDKPSTTEPKQQCQQQQQQQRAITLSLLRKRSEHNSNLISTLEELALHQEELTTIGPYLGRTCGKTLKILLLQNNVISKMVPSELKYLKCLEYLNLALNNISKIEGLSRAGGNTMEWLRKLDLTLNFVDVDDLEESVDELEGCRSLEELFLMGNPCMGIDTVDDGADGAVGGGADENTTTTTTISSQKQIGWKGCRAYIIARLPQLQFLDGKEIKPSERILATQKLSKLTSELRSLAAKRKREREKQHDDNDTNESYISDDATTTYHDPETRIKLSNELHDQKVAKEQRQMGQQAPRPKGEREWEEEHGNAVRREREREERGSRRQQHGDHCTTGKDDDNNNNIGGRIKQCNQGKYQFWFEEESPNNNNNNNNNNDVTVDSKKKHQANLVMRVAVPKHLSTSLIDVDIHPTYVSIVIKSKVLRVSLPAEVRSDTSSARRSAASGYLELVMPKVDPNLVVVGFGHVRDDDYGVSQRRGFSVGDGSRVMEGNGGAETMTDQVRRRRERLGQTLLKEGGAVSSLRIVRDQTSDDSTLVLSCSDDDDDDDDEPPPLR